MTVTETNGHNVDVASLEEPAGPMSIEELQAKVEEAEASGTAAGSSQLQHAPLEVEFPGAGPLKAWVYARFEDPNGIDPLYAINADDDFFIDVWVITKGRLWSCFCGKFCFDISLDPCGTGYGIDLNEHLGKDDFKSPFSCKNVSGNYGYVHKRVKVPANSIPADRCGGKRYDVCVEVQFETLCEQITTVVGGVELGTVQLFHSDKD